MSDGAASVTADTGATPEGATANGGRRAGMDGMLDWARHKPLIPLLIGAAAVVAIIIALLLWAGSPDYRVLYSNINEADGGRIISVLDQQGVKYKFAQGGHALLVPSNKVYLLRLQLAEKGLPSAGNVGFKIMDNEAFGISQFAEQVNFLRGLQGELANSIETLQPVSAARVHLALPKKSMFIRKRKPAKATVVLTMQSGRVLDAGQVNAIVHMVASSVRDLAPDQVTVVDQTGRLLSRTGVDGGLDGTHLDYRQKVEDGYRRRIEKILLPIVGAGNVHAQVTAQVDFSKREETKEHYGPNQGNNPAAIRSHQESTSWNDSGNDGNPSGVPGALTNTPPGAASSPINNPQEQPNTGKGANTTPDTNANARTTGTAASANDQHTNLQRQNTTNYEVDHNITHIQHHQGALERLSVAVVVNYRDEKQKNGAIKTVPLDAKTLQQITQLTREAMGYSTQRGDSLQVVNSAFSTPTAPTPPSWWQKLDWISLLATLGRYLVVLIIAIVLYRLIVRPLLKQRLKNRPAAQQGTAETIADDEETQNTPQRKPRPNKSSLYADSLGGLKAMAKKDPGMVAMIVRNWMKRDDN